MLALAGRLGVTAGHPGDGRHAAPDEAVARRLRDAVRARYDVATWRRVAQPIFDGCGSGGGTRWSPGSCTGDDFDRIEQLFEFFLVDPGIEPVVQTSRLRLAISAVQLFVQRCLLNLEPDVHPSAIDVRPLAVDEAVPGLGGQPQDLPVPGELARPGVPRRQDPPVPGAGEQPVPGDVTDDLAEEAFLGYLRALEGLARLDIRAMYVEEKSDPTANTRARGGADLRRAAPVLLPLLARTGCGRRGCR